jgi:hypothetical protein
MTQTQAALRRNYWAGLALGPLAWAIDTQLQYSLVWAGCAHDLLFFVAVTAVLLLAAFAGAWISWRAARIDAASEWKDESGGGPRTFIAWIGAGSGVIFGLTIANQLAAFLMVNTCLR